MSILNRLFEPSQKSYFLFGPRGTGKSTLMRALYADAMFIDLLNPELERQFRAHPNRLKDIVYANKEQKVFVIDEVQKVPELLSIVHQLIEENKYWQFILTGSSARKLKRSGVDLLAGRAQLKHLHPFMATEIGESFSLEQALSMGMLPLIVDSVDPMGDLKTYIALYMRKEVIQEGIIRKIDQFSHFLEVVSLSQASPINYSNIARDCMISSKTVEHFVQILEDLLLSFRLPAFRKKVKRNIIQSAKFYYFDVGVYKSIRPVGPLDDTLSLNGHALETLIAQHLRAWIDYSNQDGELFYWQTKSGLEVDFVIYGEIGFYAFEVKSSSQIRSRDLRALHEFKKDYPECECIVLYGGDERIMIGDILAIPIKQFLIKLKPNSPPN